MMLHKDKCLILGLPEPKSYDNQQAYSLRLAAAGIKLNTRIARFIGIGNLHTVISNLKRKGHQISVKHGLVHCPFTNKIPPYPVDILYMTPEQIAYFKSNKNR